MLSGVIAYVLEYVLIVLLALILSSSRSRRPTVKPEDLQPSDDVLCRNPSSAKTGEGVSGSDGSPPCQCDPMVKGDSLPLCRCCGKIVLDSRAFCTSSLPFPQYRSCVPPDKEVQP